MNFNRNVLKKIILLVIIIVFFGPFFLLILKSISSNWHWPKVLPTDLSIRAQQVISTDPHGVRAIITTIKIGTAVVILNLLLAMPAANALSRYDFRGRTIIETILFMPLLIPALAVAMGIHLTMIQLGLADHILGVIIIHLLPTLPYSIRILRAGFDRLNIKIEEQAKSLGANTFSVFSTITFPLLFPSIKSVALLTFVISLSQYVLTAIIGGGLVITLPMIYYPFFKSADTAVIASYSVLFILLPLIFLIVMELFLKAYTFVIRKG